MSDKHLEQVTASLAANLGDNGDVAIVHQTISALYHIFSANSIAIQRLSNLRIDLLVSLLQNASIPKNIHNLTLSVFSLVANKHPSVVIDHVISIVTSLINLRSNDIHSIQLVGSTLEAVLPALFNSLDTVYGFFF